MAGLSQKQFAGLLRRGMKAVDITAAELSRVTASDGGKARIDPNTISDYLKVDYPNGPPKRETRARLERAAGLPEGYLDGDIDMDPGDWKKRRRQLAAERLVKPYGEPRSHAGPFSAEHEEDEGWLWGDPVLAEEQMRRVLRRYEETSLSMVGNADLFTKEEMQRDQLGLLLLAIRQHELRGKQVPTWLLRLREEVFDGTFR